MRTALLALGLVVSGCATGPSTASKSALNALIAAQDYAGAEAYLNKVKESQYSKKNQVLYYLDRGIVLHHAGKFKESDESLDKAETRIDELYTKSISQAGGLLLLNDATMDYAGEPFERALVNVFRALNYVFLGKPDEALVESRKVERFLTELGSRLEGKQVYKDDAFARYLDAMLYADQGKRDDARISLAAAAKAYLDYEVAYRMPVPALASQSAWPAKDGELVFIHYNGVAPRKISKTFQVAWGPAIAIARSDAGSKNQQFANALRGGLSGGSAVTVSSPHFVQDPFAILASEVVIDSVAVAGTVLMEDISAIAMKDLVDRMALIRTRSIARAAVKFVVAEAASRAASVACEKMPGGYLAVKACKIGSRGTAHGLAAAAEAADTRSWAALPSQIRMARVSLRPGKYDVRVDFKNAAGETILRRSFGSVAIDAAKRTYLSYRTAH